MGEQRQEEEVVGACIRTFLHRRRGMVSGIHIRVYMGNEGAEATEWQSLFGKGYRRQRTKTNLAHGYRWIEEIFWSSLDMSCVSLTAAGWDNQEKMQSGKSYGIGLVHLTLPKGRNTVLGEVHYSLSEVQQTVCQSHRISPLLLETSWSFSQHFTNKSV